MSKQHLPGIRKVAIVGGSGFIGSAALEALQRDGVEATVVHGPRMHPSQDSQERASIVAHLTSLLSDSQCCVNAAGIASSTATQAELIGANVILPSALAEATHALNIRFIHLSSGAVQGRTKALNSEDLLSPNSPYSQSKAAGELAVAAANPKTCIYRLPGVHGPGRTTTQKIARIARSPFAFIAAPGTANSPQAHILNVADAIRFLATTPYQPPRIVHHPTEYITTTEFLNLLGNKQPRRIPKHVARGLVRIAYRASRGRPSLSTQARQLETLMMGQEQAPSWLTEEGWIPPFGKDIWAEMGKQAGRS